MASTRSPPPVTSRAASGGAFLLAVWLCSCAPSAPLDARRSHAAILGGIAAPDEPTVFFLDIRTDAGVTSTCSATLIGSRTLLTAAHCVDPVVLRATSLDIVATNAPSVAEVQPGVNTWHVVETRLHPDWHPQFGLDSDLGMALLESAPPVTPRAWNLQPIDGLEGERVRVLGYGEDQPALDAGMGVRREADLIINQLSPQLISLGNGVDRGLCHGDSGGPTLLTFGDGVERIVGVHSFTRTAECFDGADSRVDAFAGFIGQWLSDKEDVCGRDGVCSLSACATTDPDCVPPGSACRHPLECAGRRCTSDLQHPVTYCSAPCGPATACPAGLDCDPSRQVCVLPQLPEAGAGETCVLGSTYCRGGLSCNGVSRDMAVCSRPCALTSDCGADEVCRPGFTGQRVCLRPPIALPGGSWEGPAMHGCSQSAGEAMGFLAVGLMVWHARRRGNGYPCRSVWRRTTRGGAA
ncbi:MAG: trypsin-like serine protease [Myxococcaceae bacterium]